MTNISSPVRVLTHFVNLECADVSKRLSTKEIEKFWSLIIVQASWTDLLKRKSQWQIASKIEEQILETIVVIIRGLLEEVRRLFHGNYGDDGLMVHFG